MLIYILIGTLTIIRVNSKRGELRTDETINFEIFNKSNTTHVVDLPTHEQFTQTLDNIKRINGHIITVSNYEKQVKVKEPLKRDGCKNNTKATVSTTSTENECFAAVNAGFFDIEPDTKDVCIGNLIDSSVVIHKAEDGKLNANFGILQNGSIFSGYLRSIDEFQFTELISGVIWLVRNGQSNVKESLDVEWSGAQTTGSLKDFASIVSARTAIGHDSKGNVKIVSINGESRVSGVSLYEFADILVKFDIVNAINLDGGGSATVVWNGVVVNTPASTENGINVEKKLTSIICVKNVCNCHSDCKDGECVPSFCATICKQRTIHVINTLLVNNFPLALSISLVACLSVTINIAFIVTKLANMCKKKTKASWVPLAHLRDSDEESSYDEFTREEDQFIGS